MACLSGQCAACPSGLSFCGGNCVNTQIDNGNCGTCGTTCSTVSPSTAQCTAGRCLVTLATAIGGGIAGDIAVDATSVYWSNPVDSTIMKVSSGGGTPTTLASGQSIGHIAVDSTSVYWLNGGAVMKVPTGGGSLTTLASGQHYPQCIAVDGMSVYWATSDLFGAAYQSGTVMKVSTGGGTPTTLAIGQEVPEDMVVDATSVDRADSGLLTVPTVGGSTVTLVPDVSMGVAQHGIAVDGTSIYWATAGGNVMKFAFVGGTPISLVSGATGSIAVDSTSVYWTNDVAGTVMKISTSGGTPTTLASGPIGNLIAVDDTSVYFTVGNSQLMKLTPK